MKKILFLLILLSVSFSLTACSGKTGSAAMSENRIKLTVNRQQVIVRLYDNPASRDLLTLLPLTLTFREYASTEKIAYLPRKLATEGMEENNKKTDDFTYFAPWGNLAIFYKGKHQGGNGLVILGTIESGKEVFADIDSDFTVLIEKMH